jgi:hypothetical protein
VLGVFTALDSVEGDAQQAMSLNRYGYVAGNVVNTVDPTGRFAWGSSVTEQGDYCYCIGREAGIPDSHLENFAIWLKNNNPSDTFMPDTDSRKYWLYPGKPVNLPGSFAGIANIQGAGINKQGGCHCPKSVELGRCSAVINPVQNVNIDGCKCPEGMVWDPVWQWCGHPCPSGGVRPPGGSCPGFDGSVNFPPAPTLHPRCDDPIAIASMIDRVSNHPEDNVVKITGFMGGVSAYASVGGGFSILRMADVKSGESRWFINSELGIGFGGRGISVGIVWSTASLDEFGKWAANASGNIPYLGGAFSLSPLGDGTCNVTVIVFAASPSAGGSLSGSYTMSAEEWAETTSDFAQPIPPWYYSLGHLLGH